MRPVVRPLLLVSVFSLLVGCDQVTKHAAVTCLDAPAVLVEGLFELRYAENRDTAFSLARNLGFGQPPGWVMALLSTLAFGLIGAALYKQRHEATRMHLAAMVLIGSGAVANLIDRFARGFVVDFMYLHGWPIFNVADVLIVAGIGAWLFASRSEGYAPPAHEQPD